MTDTGAYLRELLASRLQEPSAAWLDAHAEEIRGGVAHDRFAALFSLASRFAPRGALAPTKDEIRAAGELLPGFSPERWTTLEAMRVRLVLARDDLASPSGVDAIEEVFRYADEGELCALYRCLAHLPAGERFVWRAGEGCRTNMTSVFEAVVCDTPYPALHFGDLAWRQLVIKALFVDAPLWRVDGLDDRLSPELARMALDLVEERRSAGREIQPELWLCLGRHGGERARKAVEEELATGGARGRSAAALALARAGESDRLPALLERESDPDVRATLERALAGACDQSAFGALDTRGDA